MSKKYVAAVSGGPDSMALLYLYAKQIAVVCHVNYNKRNSANRDKDIVESFCKKHEIPLELLEVDQKIYDKYKTDTNNFQTIARMIRYDFFIKIAAKYKLSTILIAHNKDDFLETALMQKKRNSKTLFLGIQKKSKYKNIQIYRPLLQM
jgi:tRNA(Ile)-lysidine synthase